MKPNVPDHIKPYVDRAKQLENVDSYDEALSVYREALSLYPDIAVLHNNLGCALANLKRYNEAKREFLQAITLTSINRQNGIMVPDSYPQESMQNLKAIEAILSGETAYPARLPTAGSPLRRETGGGCIILLTFGITAIVFLIILNCL